MSLISDFAAEIDKARAHGRAVGLSPEMTEWVIGQQRAWSSGRGEPDDWGIVRKALTEAAIIA